MKYISLKSVLYGLAQDFPEGEYDETRMAEWAMRGYLQFNSRFKYKTSTALLYVESHKVCLPSTVKRINQIAAKRGKTSEQSRGEFFRKIGFDTKADSFTYLDGSKLDEKAITNLYEMGWQAMMPSTTSLGTEITTDNCSNCGEKYYLSVNNCLTTSFKDGLILISFEEIPKDSEGYPLIYDDETIKEALYHYVRFMYYQSKPITNASVRMMNWNLERYSLLKAKSSGNLEMPDLGSMETIKRIREKWFPNKNAFKSFFFDIASKEDLNI